MIDPITQLILEGAIMGASPKRAKDLPKPLLKFLEKNGYTTKIIEQQQKSFGSFPSNDCRRWSDYKGREYLCTSKWNFANQLQLYIVATTEHGDMWAYSFNKREMFFYSHEENIFPFQAIADKEFLETPIWPEEYWDRYGKETYGEYLKKEPWPKSWTRRWKVNDWLKAATAKKEQYFYMKR